MVEQEASPGPFRHGGPTSRPADDLQRPLISIVRLAQISRELRHVTVKEFVDWGVRTTEVASTLFLVFWLFPVQRSRSLLSQ
jgi:hypothetical protein